MLALPEGQGIEEARLEEQLIETCQGLLSITVVLIRV
jgi:hypothetical protein